MKEGVFVINYFAHCVDVEEVYKNMISPVYEKYKLTYMEFTVLMFLANNPQYNTGAWQEHMLLPGSVILANKLKHFISFSSTQAVSPHAAVFPE